MESSLASSRVPEQPLATVLQGLDLLADIVLAELGNTTPRKCEHLITELVHPRNVTRSLVHQRIADEKSFAWLYQMRFYLDLGNLVYPPMERLKIKMANAEFPYGWEYLSP
jgi:dynein cytoplasmic 1 heavy chain